MAKYVVQSRLSFAKNSVVAENLRLRNLPLLQAEDRYWQGYELAKIESELLKQYEINSA